jgi:peptidoglycan-N-acetylglucosamine deacetylase
MRTDGDWRGGARAPNRHVMSRRMLIVGAGGVVFGSVAMGWRGGGHAGSPADQATHGAARQAGLAEPAAGGQQVTTASGDGTRAPAAPATGGHVPASAHKVPAQPMYYVDDGPKVIALTIDDGPSPVYTPQILQLLAKYRVTAAFSMIGENAGYYPGVARDVADAGHKIVNHTWDHRDLTQMGRSQVRTEIVRATDAIADATGVHPQLFRAPYGAWSRTTLEYCASMGLTPLDWSVDPRDWARPGVKAIVTTIMATTHTGSIILEHDGGGNRSQTVAALKIAIPRLLDEGYRFEAP